MSRHRFITQQRAADHVEVTPRTIRSWISQGLLTGYRLPGQRAIRIDLDELEAQMRVIPTVSRPKRPPFGPDARIVVVEDEVELDETNDSPTDKQPARSSNS